LQDAQEQINEQINEQISAPVASIDVSPLETSATDIIPTAPAVSAEPVAVSIATIANAYEGSDSMSQMGRSRHSDRPPGTSAPPWILLQKSTDLDYRALL
jgi:hypothetical protein